MRSVFYMLSRQEPYHELGANYFDERRRHYTVDRLARRIEHLGYRVRLELVTTSMAWDIFKAALNAPHHPRCFAGAPRPADLHPRAGQARPPARRDRRPPQSVTGK